MQQKKKKKRKGGWAITITGDRVNNAAEETEDASTREEDEKGDDRGEVEGQRRQQTRKMNCV